MNPNSNLYKQFNNFFTSTTKLTGVLYISHDGSHFLSGSFSFVAVLFISLQLAAIEI